jgi:UDP-N-acetylglucosamine pyrophosphorylase
MGADHFEEFALKMRNAGINPAAIRAFQHSYRELLSGQAGLIPENTIDSVPALPTLAEISADAVPDQALLSQCVIVKLNGGLGTSMGLERAKSLLEAKDGLTFLDLIVRQVLHLRRTHGVHLPFLLMNSFSTSADTRAFLQRYQELGSPEDWELMQNQVPKVDAKTFCPASWPQNPHLEWCPPGHGDLYACLLGSGRLTELLEQGVRFLFVSNSDNLGATLDLALLSYFAASDKPFLMEAAERTHSDRKGGHLALSNGKLILRESAQCPEADQPSFQDIHKHRFFNTNNLWLRLDQLKQQLDAHGGFVPLPVIRNLKTIDPRDKLSLPVIQLETAMGALIQAFPDSGAVVVPRSRFAPVKTTADLLVLRSDAYQLTPDWRVTPANGIPPEIDLDPAHYKLIDQLNQKLGDGVPSLKHCRKLTVQGPVALNAKNIIRGEVLLKNQSSQTRRLSPGQYEDCTVTL